jgi:signal transduction histidine kinase
MSAFRKTKLVFKDIFSYFLGGFSLCFIALFFTAYYSYQTIYQQAIEESSAAIKGAITTEQRKMSSLVESYGYWGQTYNQVVKNFDLAWIEENITTDVKTNFSIPYVAIFDADLNFTTLYSNNIKFGTPKKLAPSVLSQPLFHFKEGIGKSKSNTTFIKDGDKIYMVSISKITDTTRASKYAFLVLIKPVTEAYMDQLSEDYAVSNIDLVAIPNQFKPGSKPSLAIKEDEKIIGYMTWSPHDSATSILKILIPVGFIVALLLTFIGFMITRQIIRANSGYSEMLTELAQAANELMVAKEKSDLSSEAKTRFLSMMSHEIKTPMNGLMGMITLLKDTELNDAQIQYVNTMENSTDSLLKLVDNILEFSKLESGEVSVMFSDINIRQMVSEIHGLLVPISIQKKLKFETHFEDTVPMIIRSDAIRLRQIILHLVTNALKFTKVGSVWISVTAVDMGNNQCELSIQIIDTGIGIPDGIKETLFQDFFQVDGDINRTHDGAGLGLSIVKNIVTLLGAKVGVESKLGQGSVFWFQVNAETVAKLNISELKDIPSSPLHHLNLLLVEEEINDGSYTRHLLEKVGNQVATASNVAIAADMLAHTQYDAILVNIPKNESLDGDFSPTMIKAAMTGKLLMPIVGIAQSGVTSYDSNQYDCIINSPLTSSKLTTALTEAIGSKQVH